MSGEELLIPVQQGDERLKNVNQKPENQEIHDKQPYQDLARLGPATSCESLENGGAGGR